MRYTQVKIILPVGASLEKFPDFLIDSEWWAVVYFHKVPACSAAEICLDYIVCIGTDCLIFFQHPGLAAVPAPEPLVTRRRLPMLNYLCAFTIDTSRILFVSHRLCCCLNSLKNINLFCLSNIQIIKISSVPVLQDNKKMLQSKKFKEKMNKNYFWFLFLIENINTSHISWNNKIHKALEFY